MRWIDFCSVALLALNLATPVHGQTFDAASVKLTGPEVQQPYTITGGPGTNDPGRFRAPRISMSTLLARAFNVSIDQITGPPWLHDVAHANYYTIVATIPPGTTKEQFQKMLQNLLVERFHLVFHREVRDFPGYELVVDKGGPKFAEITPTEGANVGAAPDVRILLDAPAASDGFPKVPGPRTMSQSGRDGTTRTKYQERTMTEFVANLGFVIGSSQGKGALEGFLQPRVVDKTGLTGRYTFVLEYHDEGSANLARMLPASGGNSEAGGFAPVAVDPGTGPNIFTAIQKQLGLRLDKVAAVPLAMIIVESVDKVPTEN
jgi:uncharacterized protein (TIGR03435 family)